MPVFVLRIAFVISLICFPCIIARAQEDTDGDAFYNISLAESSISILTDETLFFQPLEGTSGMFARKSVFNFSAMRYLRRGYDRWHDKTIINNIEITDPISKSPSYQLQISLNSINKTVSYEPRSIGQSTIVGVGPQNLAAGNSVAISVMDRAYRVGVKAHTTGTTGAWGYSVSAAGRWGRNGHIDGMFTDGEIFSLGLERKMGRKGSLSFFGIVSPTKQGIRSAAVMEAFELTGDKMYNPSWGYYNGEIRNSKVRQTMQPFGMVNYKGVLGDRTRLTASLAYTGGATSHSGLLWFEGMNPYPDYYRYMPSFSTPADQQKLITEYWRSNDSQITQLNWSDIIAQNRLSDKAVYILENKIEKHSITQLAVYFSTTTNRYTTILYGISARNDDKRFYSDSKDNLGSVYSDRRYDYNMSYKEVSVNAGINYRKTRFHVSADAKISSVVLAYKDNRKDAKGANEVNFSPYNLGVNLGYSFSAKQNSLLRVIFSQEHPGYNDIFIAPLTRSDIVNNIDDIKIRSIELSHNITLPWMKLSIAGYYTQIDDETNVRGYYDDLTSQFCNMIMRGVDKRYYGAELASNIKLTDRLAIDIIGSFTNSTYSSNPMVDIISDANSSAVSIGERARIDGYKLGSTPQTVASAEFTWSGRRGWRIAAGINYMADSYVSINPLRRTPRYYSNVGSEAKFDEMTVQERLPQASTVNLSVMKSTFFKNSRLFIILSINNLLDKKDIIYDGYEQMRIRKPVNEISGDWTVFPTKYRFGYGRTYFCSINYMF